MFLSNNVMVDNQHLRKLNAVFRMTRQVLLLQIYNKLFLKDYI